MIVLNIDKKLLAADGEMNLGLNLTLEKGQLITLYGESGAGKTSTLRLLSGLMRPDHGKIIVNGKTWFDSDKKIYLPPQKRNIGFVFQDYALFPNMTVLENLEFALGKGQDKKNVSDLIEIIELGTLQHRKPETLSGGQKQRVALARALAERPDILLLDEPLAALDAKIRLKLQDYIQRTHREFGLTTILISHDIGEIIKLSDHVIFLEKGNIIRQGNPDELFINSNISGKFKFTGEILKIEQQEIVYIATVLIQNSVVKVIVQDSEVQDLHVGNKVVVATKAFNPILYKIEG
ncbi:ATP-binding cassette domain-containing protein [Flagellimonas sp. 389]|uniref:ABC transporter ATP-binding protein n=1 Tax=Flagellimonas sp. 389 TaxID=2835862 RepID=UPI001BD6B4C4|nr:ATP-binding cassette domain-containing protein [Flagellimonas sp. 389]MBS9461665.1 ATP-binding cassette domain-containing protein [Flagellimonas sp. 389]